MHLLPNPISRIFRILHTRDYPDIRPFYPLSIRMFWTDIRPDARFNKQYLKNQQNIWPYIRFYRISGSRISIMAEYPAYLILKILRLLKFGFGIFGLFNRYLLCAELTLDMLSAVCRAVSGDVIYCVQSCLWRCYLLCAELTLEMLSAVCRAVSGDVICCVQS